MSDLDTYPADINEAIAAMQRMALEFRLKEYYALTEHLISTATGEELGEVYLHRAQLKLFTADATIAEDLQSAERLLPNGSGITSFLDDFAPMDPNAFLMFGPEPGSIAAFLDAMRLGAPILRRLCGETGYQITRQIESEILYFSGRIREALSIAEPLHAQLRADGKHLLSMMAAYVLVRCYLSMGKASKIERVMAEIIGTVKSKNSAECSKMYQTIRSWMNLTTGWSGDTPRYHITPEGAVFPALEDRMAAMETGIAELGPTEAPFADYARIICPSVCTMRQLYAEIFNMMAQFRFGLRSTAEGIFHSISPKAQGNGMIMPFAEYGKQIVPLFENILKEGRHVEHSAEWVKSLMANACQYEENLSRYRDD